MILNNHDLRISNIVFELIGFVNLTTRFDLQVLVWNVMFYKKRKILTKFYIIYFLIYFNVNRIWGLHLVVSEQGLDSLRTTRFSKESYIVF